MNKTLFAITDDFTASSCFGMSSKETTELLTDALEDGRQHVQTEVREAVKARPDLRDRADEFEVRLDRGMYVIVAPGDIEQEVLAAEYGDLENRPRPLLRSAVTRSRVGTVKAINDRLLGT